MTVNKVSTFYRFLVFLYYNEYITKSFIMKTFVIEEKFVGYADITIEAETEEEAIQIYKDGNYKDCNYNLDEYFYEYEFNSIREEKSNG